MRLDPDTCHRALAARDRRSDGLFFVGVTSTGVYCRPVCPSRTPGRDRCRFFARAAEAARAGFRPCRRCRPEVAPAGGAVDLRLDYRPPLDWAALLAFLAARASAGVDEVSEGAWRRTVRLGRRTGWVEVTADPRRPALRVRAARSLAGALVPLTARLRALFDLDARPDAVAGHLSRDRRLAASLRRHPGLRVPGAFDGFEAAVRIVLGQQVTVKAATTVASRLVAALGEPLETPFPGLRLLAPTPAALLAAGEGRLAALGMPGARARTLLGLARATAAGDLVLDRAAGPEALARLRALPGVGEWTAQVLALRALGDPDAFPASDLAVMRALGAASPREAEARSARWRPWRSYAVLHLWTGLADAAARETGG